ncbi:MliC family protein [Ciceribacter sp. L1K23]|uniref:MliC family protein n=1 Tax=Ciceribacter sp. L1K23 TaxID=2820276 RepID=UPI001B82C606|nr:MliC family protein [Ciceribacter sp. L1K23]MBR0555945.1 MliC family protein [Ciceribacter sp. L1K23]
MTQRLKIFAILVAFLFCGAARAETVTFACEDGSELIVAFSEEKASLTLASGEQVELPQQVSGSGFWYSNGRYELRGKGDEAQFAIGRMAPITCSVKASSGGPLDQPKMQVIQLPAGETGYDMAGELRCYGYQGFSLKELDLGEKGAAGLYIAPANAACALDGKDMRIQDDMAGYVLGARGPFAFFSAADGWNGGLLFVVYDTLSASRLMDDSFSAVGLQSASVADGVLTLRYDRTYSADCSLLAEPDACGAAIRSALKLPADAVLPDCRPGYQPAIDMDPAQKTAIEAWPSVIDYPVETVVSAGAEPNVTPLAGPMACRPSA